MIKSMTGFGKYTGEYPDKTIQVEVRSLNSKNADKNSGFRLFMYTDGIYT